MDYSFIDLLPHYTMIVDEQSGIIKYANDKIENRFSISLIGENLYNLIDLEKFSESDVYSDVKLKTSQETIAFDFMETQKLKNNSDYLVLFKDHLYEYNNRYKDIFNQAADGIVVVNKKLILLEVNEAFCKIVGINKKDLVGKSAFNLAYKYAEMDTLKSLTLNLQNVIKGKQIHGLDIKYKNKTLAISMNSSKESPYYIGMMRDITQRIKVQEKLKESEEKFKFLSKSTFEGILVHSKGKIIEVNESFGKLTGYSREESIGENILDYIPSIKDRSLAAYYMSLKKATPYVIEIKTKDGKSLKVEIQAKNVKHQGKKLRIAAVRDVTEREKIQTQLEESEKRYKAVFENTGAASCILEEDGTISLANSKFAKLSGYSIKEILHKKTWMDFVDPKDLNRMIGQHKLRRTNKTKALTQYEFTFIDKFKNKKEILVVIDIIEQSKQSVASLLDITYLKETEQKLIKTNKELKNAKEKAEESDLLKSAFLANMSHEIRTPMNGIIGFASLLEESDITDEEKKQYIDVIKRGGQRMLETVNDLIDISKIETGQIETHISEVNINKEIYMLYEFFKPETENKGLKLIWNEKLPYNKEIIKTDDQKLISILTNLIKNAIKYTDKGQIEIKVDIKKKYAYFNVIDTGIGIPENRLKAVFNRFEQVDFTDTRAFDGSGLGLAISKAYVEILGGKIDCKSVEGKGSDFHFSIPIITNSSD